ncbi:MAG: (2Fe-2S)-binding protein [Deltaproteobacteria bacterium]|nr:(2Fe-2S)-binding protein [Deltaproteobacteria bacterium]
MAGEIVVTVDGQELACTEGRPLLNAIVNAGLLIDTACGGQGICHLCRVTVESGRASLPPANAIEKRALGNVLIAQGMRLSCQILVRAPLRVRIVRRPT